MLWLLGLYRDHWLTAEWIAGALGMAIGRTKVALVALKQRGLVESERRGPMKVRVRQAHGNSEVVERWTQPTVWRACSE